MPDAYVLLKNILAIQIEILVPLSEHHKSTNATQALLSIQVFFVHSGTMDR